MLRLCQPAPSICVLCCLLFLAACTPTAEVPSTPIAAVQPAPSHTSVIDDPSAAETPPVLTWQREGGVAGFCDEVRLYDSGLMQTYSCEEEASAPVWEAQLSTQALAELHRWQEQWASTDHTWADEATADGMTERIEFIGEGTESPSELDQQAMRDLAVKEFLTQQP